MDKDLKIGLALSGGGARGFAHLGVLKKLEQEKIPIFCISGTSMGAVIGGLYAAFGTVDSIINFFNFSKISSFFETKKFYQSIAKGGLLSLEKAEIIFKNKLHNVKIKVKNCRQKLKDFKLSFCILIFLILYYYCLFSCFYCIILNMINKIPIKDLKNYLNKEVIIAGFVQTIRDHGNLKFLLIRDRTGTVQVVITKDNQNFEIAKKIITESVVKIQGIVKEEKQAPNGFEINPIEIEILSLANGELPIPIVSEKGAEEVDQTKRLDWRFLDLRNPRNLKIFQVWTELEKGFRNYFNQNGFIQIYTPSLMSTSSEGGSEVFEVKYFDRKAYLAQSPQFYKQMAMSAGFEKVFTFGPVFRAEPSFTSRHLTEFTGWDFEISYIDSHFDVMAVEEDLIISGFKALKESLDLNIEIPQKPFPYHTLKETKEILKKEGVVSEKEDLTPEEERKIWEITKQKTGSDFIWITDFPISVRPFYHQRYEDNPQITKSFDLIYKGVEITTGSQREHRIEILEKQAIEKGVKLETISDYLNFFRYGSPPHGGVGIGPARLIMKILDLLNVKEATYLPRDVKRLTP